MRRQSVERQSTIARPAEEVRVADDVELGDEPEDVHRHVEGVEGVDVRKGLPDHVGGGANPLEGVDADSPVGSTFRTGC